MAGGARPKLQAQGSQVGCHKQTHFLPVHTVHLGNKLAIFLKYLISHRFPRLPQP